MKNKKVVEKHKPTADDWAKIRVLFLKDVSLDDILKEMPEVDVSKKSISEKMCREGMNKKKREIEARTNKELKKKKLQQMKSIFNYSMIHWKLSELF